MTMLSCVLPRVIPAAASGQVKPNDAGETRRGVTRQKNAALELHTKSRI